MSFKRAAKSEYIEINLKSKYFKCKLKQLNMS